MYPVLNIGNEKGIPMKKSIIYCVIFSAVLILASCVTSGRVVTPLHEACRDGQKAKAAELISSGTNINIQDPEGRTPLHYVCGNGDSAIAELLIAASANPNIQDDNGRTPLHYATENCYADIVEMLLNAGADKTISDSNGLTPLDLESTSEISEILAK